MVCIDGAMALSPSLHRTLLALSGVSLSTMVGVGPANLGLYEGSVFSAYRLAASRPTRPPASRCCSTRPRCCPPWCWPPACSPSGRGSGPSPGRGRRREGVEPASVPGASVQPATEAR
jgi:hypothetical protein